MGRYYWTDEDIKYLAENYGKMSIEFLSIKLSRTVCALMNKTKQLRLGQSVNKGIKQIIYKNCKYCGKEFETDSKRVKYCSKECVDLKQKEHRTIRQNRVRKEIREQRKFQSQQDEKILKNLNNNDYENIKIFFRINCLSIDKKQGIEKIRQFTKREDAEIIYRNLRKEFIEKGLI